MLKTVKIFENLPRLTSMHIIYTNSRNTSHTVLQKKRKEKKNNTNKSTPKRKMEIVDILVT